MDPLNFHNGTGYQCGFPPRNKFEKEGYEFADWNTVTDGSAELLRRIGST